MDRQPSNQMPQAKAVVYVYYLKLFNFKCVRYCCSEWIHKVVIQILCLLWYEQ